MIRQPFVKTKVSSNAPEVSEIFFVFDNETIEPFSCVSIDLISNFCW